MNSAVVQITTAFLGAVGFGVLFRIRGWKLWVCGLGGMFGWSVYLLLEWLGLGLFWSLLLASAAVSILAELLARVLRTPVILLLVPMLVPMIPGGDLYYAMYQMINKEYERFGSSSTKVLSEACAIALGIIIASYLARLLPSSGETGRDSQH